MFTIAATGCHSPEGTANSDAITSQPLTIEDSEPIVPIPNDIDATAPGIALGEQLFKSRLLSDDGRAACVDCHHLDHALAINSAFAELPSRPKTATNSLTLFNLRFDYRLSWIGKYESLREHNDALMANPKIMRTSWRNVALRPRMIPEWDKRFRRVFIDGVTAENVRTALMQYEESLVTPNAPFDRWLRGDPNAVSCDAVEGFELFKSHGCVSCHQGVAVGGNMLARFGTMRNFFAKRSAITEADLGRFVLTHCEEDRHVFRVPSLRNVAKSAPYFHDGSASTLEEAVTTMGLYQLGLQLSPQDIRLIVEFLTTLTGEYRGEPI